MGEGLGMGAIALKIENHLFNLQSFILMLLRMLHHSGGVADAQPPATGFYPYQDADSPKDATATRKNAMSL
jgi:hypothetical protein